MSRTVFLSYATPHFALARDELCRSAIAAGFDHALARGPDDLDPTFAAAHAAVLTQERGGGFWLWKPQIILQELQRLDPGDLLVYSDAGRSSYYQFRHFPKRLARKARESGFLLGPTIPQHGKLANWTKRDAFILLGMDRLDVYDLPLIQATWSLWTPTREALEFLAAWRDACADPRALTDAPNELGQPDLPLFRDHRHDQSVLSLLVYRQGAPYLDYSKRGVPYILGLRPQSALAHMFLRRIDDAELLERGGVARAMLTSLLDLRTAVGTVA